MFVGLPVRYLLIQLLFISFSPSSDTLQEKITILSVTMRDYGNGKMMYVKVRNDFKSAKTFQVEMILQDKDGIPYDRGVESVSKLAPGKTAITDRYFDKISGAIGSARIKKVY